jgi:hypothetical protein
MNIESGISFVKALGDDAHVNSFGVQSESVNSRSWKEFAAIISAAWGKSAAGFIEAAKYLREAKDELSRDESDSLIRLKLPFVSSVSRKLLCIADNAVLCSHGNKLPPCWTTIYTLSQLDAEVLKAKLADGTIHPGMQRKEAVALRKPLGTSQSSQPSAVGKLRAAWKAVSPAELR